MARSGNPERKGELLDQIMEYLVGVPLAQASFRALADALGVSTFALVYHFGNREQLDREIIGVVRERQASALANFDPEGLDPESYIAVVTQMWDDSVSRRGLLTSRLSFEAGVTETLREPEGGVLLEVHHNWLNGAEAWLRAHGVDADRARVEAALYIDTLSGIRYRLHLDGDLALGRELFTLAVTRFAALGS
ncbi:TetR/AcrR family transcriptional regulator [Mycetocola spongiae]|uniref:TetR/AcrR family transcriptional regulator n=1 Tax=Mycetocola spongiae TaxID=2859226 RepID=UPI001CF1359E|nr:TetR/AcrR family transcriptional regulator [Mycetocola spongiae]UCR88304.1 TetR/AcrR family transcriptional regulator [Mycetocola spongiae]